jgi:hypothetical protein
LHCPFPTAFIALVLLLLQRLDGADFATWRGIATAIPRPFESRDANILAFDFPARFLDFRFFWFKDTDFVSTTGAAAIVAIAAGKTNDRHYHDHTRGGDADK